MAGNLGDLILNVLGGVSAGQRIVAQRFVMSMSRWSMDDDTLNAVAKAIYEARERESYAMLPSFERAPLLADARAAILGLQSHLKQRLEQSRPGQRGG